VLNFQQGPKPTSPRREVAVSQTKRASKSWVFGGGGLAVLVIASLIYLASRPVSPPKVSGYVPVTHDGHRKALVGTDGSRIFFNEWEVPVLGGSPRRVGEAAGQAAAWSPDGQKIVYADGHDLFLARSDGSEPHKLVSAPDQAYYPAWSPDGTVIRFNVGAVGALTPAGRLYQVLVDGTNLHPLVPDWHTPPEECCGQWTLDGRYFVFQSQGNIWALAEKRNFLGKGSGQPSS
jgi:hypothetical protein